MAYCDSDDVQRLIPNRRFDTSSKPTLAQVNSLITDVSNRIDAALRGAGFSVPVGAGAGYDFLTHLNAVGAAALVERAIVDIPSGKESGTGSVLQKQFDELLKQVVEGKVILAGASGGPQLASDLVHVTQSDNRSDGTEKEPAFTMDMTF